MDTASLVISNSTDKSYQLADVVLDQTGRGANAWSKKRKHCDRWTVEETDRFYLGLQKFGTDFTMLAHWLGRCACVPACLRACVLACCAHAHAAGAYCRHFLGPRNDPRHEYANWSHV